jgi:hypothetical protein
MLCILGFARDQLVLLPEAVDDTWTPTIRSIFIDAFVDGLDFAGAGSARAEAKATGRPGYAPGDLMKLCLRLPQPGPIEPMAGTRVPPLAGMARRICRFPRHVSPLEHHVREILRYARCNQQHSVSVRAALHRGQR